MKQFISIVAALLFAATALAQSTNPLNYSGKMFITSIDLLSTPRYVSYEDHAIISTDMGIPMVEVTKVIFDFEKNKITMNDKECDIKVTASKKYTLADGSWVVVIYIDFIGEADKYELVWQEKGTPYLQEIMKTDEGVKIVRMHLSIKPSVTSPEEAVIEMLNSYGAF
ncbi:MAG: hypothetical protein MR690_02750 [Rikenellaceae bacterium]|nr:hypothetical protein [Rikenellaceae bacterium]